MPDDMSIGSVVVGVAFSELLARTGRAYATEEEMRAIEGNLDPTAARMIRLGLFTREEWLREIHVRELSLDIDAVKCQ